MEKIQLNNEITHQYSMLNQRVEKLYKHNKKKIIQIKTN